MFQKPVQTQEERPVLSPFLWATEDLAGKEGTEYVGAGRQEGRQERWQAEICGGKGGKEEMNPLRSSKETRERLL